MPFWNNLLKFFAIYTMKKNRDEADAIPDEGMPSDSTFCDVCQYPIASCVCGKFKKSSCGK